METCLIKQYLTSLNTVRRAENTLESYGRFLKKLSEYLTKNYGIKLTAEEAENIKGYMLSNYLSTRQDLSDSSKNIYVSYMKAFFKYCQDNGFISDNPAKALRTVKIVVDEVEDERQISDNLYSTKDIGMLFNSFGKRNLKRNRAMVALILGTGLRVSELCSLDLGDIRNMKEGIFACKRKGGGRYWVAMSEFAIPYLSEYMEDFDFCENSHPLFITEQCQRMNRVTAYRTISSIQKIIGKATGVHRLRHAFLSALNNACENDAVVRDVAAHSSIRTTNGYMHSTLEQRTAAVSRLAWQQ